MEERVAISMGSIDVEHHRESYYGVGLRFH